MYRYTPSEVDRERAHHQAVIQGADDLDVKRIGNLGELAFECFCREYLPVEMWDWMNEQAIRRCNEESFSAYDFEVFGYEVDVKTSRDVSAFLPRKLLDNDPDDDIIAMAWHRDDEDALMLLGWTRVDTLKSKVEADEGYASDNPSQLDHLTARPMNELIDLGPNTAHMNQRPTDPFEPGDRVVKSDGSSRSPGVVVEVLPPEKDGDVHGTAFEGEAVNVAYAEPMNAGPGAWRDYHPAELASYCDDQDIKLYTYKHTNIEHAEHPFVVGDRVIKTDHDDPDPAVVVERDGGKVEVAYEGGFGGEVPESGLADYCEENDVKLYGYEAEELEPV
ncbi:hypothetical protein EGH25_11600 [Haladaptatus sp. F3-133]|uniref:Uncharacterized protein n=1 Tax=Halorutilus salinus TaxID=2487751 RepID=A0A9Q4C5T1_9EURY|nr:hypothetical protein [Halorutilus salinus]MCX2819993.1 hypothetical protein [Halorutilus salinus]